MCVCVAVIAEHAATANTHTLRLLNYSEKKQLIRTSVIRSSWTACQLFAQLLKQLKDMKASAAQIPIPFFYTPLPLFPGPTAVFML